METPRPPIRVSILDRDSSTRTALARVIQNGAGLQLTSLHEDGEKALLELPLLKPQVALIDATVLDGSAAVFMATIRMSAPGLRVVMMLPRLDPAAMLLQFNARADGYLAKIAPGQEVIRAVNEIAKTGFFMCLQIQKTVMCYFERVRVVSADSGLSSRELEIATLLVSYQEKEIAQALRIASGTVHTHIKSIYSKLGVHSRADFVRKWTLIATGLKQ